MFISKDYVYNLCLGEIKKVVMSNHYLFLFHSIILI